MTDSTAPVLSEREEKKKLWTVISASSAGTLIEWYDFYIFGALATIISKKFFPAGNEFVALLSTLATFAVGFVVRPFGALVFGRVGDVVGRKYAFLVTLIMMGLATFLIGVIPEYSQIGVAAPILMLILRIIQGLALGGEYGGAATYVAEHAPADRRGYYTSFIQITATAGLFVSLMVILGGKLSLGAEAFEAWGWRIPFLLSAVLVIFSYIIRRRMNESPVFAEMKASGKGSKHPWRDSFLDKGNLKIVLIALFGATMGQGVVWYTGQFYAMFFLTTVLKIDSVQANVIMAAALLLGTPLFVYVGHVSDKIGRKNLMLTGMLLAVLAYVPIFSALKSIASTDGVNASRVQIGESKEVLLAKDDPKLGLLSGSLTYESTFETTFANGIVAKETLRERPSENFMETNPTDVVVVDKKLPIGKAFTVGALIFILVTFVTLVYGPIAAFLVEMFPTRIRYSSMSLPYHIGNGIFGGLVPLISTYLVERTKNDLGGLAYPMAVAAICFIIGFAFLKDNHGKPLDQIE